MGGCYCGRLMVALRYERLHPWGLPHEDTITAVTDKSSGSRPGRETFDIHQDYSIYTKITGLRLTVPAIHRSFAQSHLFMGKSSRASGSQSSTPYPP